MRDKFDYDDIKLKYSFIREKEKTVLSIYVGHKFKILIVQKNRSNSLRSE